MFNEPLPPPPPSPHTHAHLLADYFALEFSAVGLIDRYKLSPTQFADFWADPETKRALEAFEASQSFRRRHHAHEYQMLSAESLVSTAMDRRGHPESRRAATVLARLSMHIQRPRATKEPTAPAVAVSSPKETIAPAIDSPPLPASAGRGRPRFAQAGEGSCEPPHAPTDAGPESPKVRVDPPLAPEKPGPSPSLTHGVHTTHPAHARTPDSLRNSAGAAPNLANTA